MAISKQRLEELIKEGATIWCSYKFNYNVIAVNLTDKNRFVIYTDDMSILDRDTEYTYQLKNLYETQKQAEWVFNHHSTRTEELNLPMWEEFKNSKLKWVGFWSKEHDNYWLYLRYRKIILSRLLDDGYEVEQHKWDATEENYKKACDLCLKLFNGEE